MIPSEQRFGQIHYCFSIFSLSVIAVYALAPRCKHFFAIDTVVSIKVLLRDRIGISINAKNIAYAIATSCAGMI